MKIGIDARMYGAGKNRGIGRYVVMLLDHLQDIDKENQYIVFLNRDNFDEFKPKYDNFSKVKINIPWYSLLEQIFLPFLIGKYKLDLIHFPHFNAPVLYKGKFAITIHDLIMTHYTEDRSTTKNKFIYRLKIIIAKWLVKKAATSASFIFTPSDYTKQDIIKRLGVDESKIKVTYEAVDGKEEKINKVMPSKLNIQKPYLFYVGAAYPHKNLELMIAAFRRFNKQLNWQLVLAGKLDYFYQRLKSEIVREGENISILGEVSDSELDWLYHNASVFIFPSQIEGFGLPPLEAMSHGCPVVASRSSSLPEVLGKAALFFDQNNEADLVRVLEMVTVDKELRQDLINKGKERVKNFSWHKMAEETRQGYNFVIN